MSANNTTSLTPWAALQQRALAPAESPSAAAVLAATFPSCLLLGLLGPFFETTTTASGAGGISGWLEAGWTAAKLSVLAIISISCCMMGCGRSGGAASPVRHPASTAMTDLGMVVVAAVAASAPAALHFWAFVAANPATMPAASCCRKGLNVSRNAG